MTIAAAILGVLLLATVLWDAFETVVLPRRVSRQLRLTRLFYRASWPPFAGCAALFKSVNRREAFLSLYGPLSLVMLLALWAGGLITAFAFLHYGAGSAVALSKERSGLLLDFYMSGSTFFTLGLGDVAPVAWRARAVTIVEAGMGFGFLALVIGYFPVTYQAFSARETSISLLDARAGSPPSAAELLRRHRGPEGLRALESVLHEWEHWAAELLETHLSYPMLATFRPSTPTSPGRRAHHDPDASALIVGAMGRSPARPSHLRHRPSRRGDLAPPSAPSGSPPTDCPLRYWPVCARSWAAGPLAWGEVYALADSGSGRATPSPCRAIAPALPEWHYGAAARQLADQRLGRDVRRLDGMT